MKYISRLRKINYQCTCNYILGEYISEKDRCSNCHGKKVVKETKILEVHVDKGMHEQQKIYFRGEGDQQVSYFDVSVGCR